jgi:hypothetical protein
LTHGVTGFVAQTAAEYAEAILRLAGDRMLRELMGEAARSSALGRAWTAVFDGVYRQYSQGYAQGVLQIRGIAGAKRRGRQKTFWVRPVS